MSNYSSSYSSSPLLVKTARDSVSPEPDVEFVGKTYKTRWFVLLVFFSHVMYTNIAWSNVDSIANLAECYYDVNVFWINSLSNLFFVTYVLFFVFATWFLGRYGLRWAAIVSGCMGAAGAWLRFAGAGADYFWILLPGQALASVPNILEWSAPALISAVWFPPNERAIATTMVGAIAPQFGIVISLVLGPVIFKNSQTTIVCEDDFDRNSFAYKDWEADIYNRMVYYLLGQAIFASILVPLSFMVPTAPPTPPSVSKQVEDEMEKMTVLQSLLALVKNVNYMLFVIVFGILLGVSAVYVTIYEEVLTHSGYSNYDDTKMSYLGLSIQVVAVVVLIATGKWIDLTKTFYGTLVVVCFGSTVLATGLAVAVLLQLNFYIVCVLATSTVAAVVMFQAVAYEFGVEMTFPVPEAVSVSLLNAFSQVLATIMTMIASAMIKTSAHFVFFFVAGCILIGFIIQIFIRPKLRRVELDNSSGISVFNNCCNYLQCNTSADNTTIQTETTAKFTNE